MGTFRIHLLPEGVQRQDPATQRLDGGVPPARAAPAAARRAGRADPPLQRGEHGSRRLHADRSAAARNRVKQTRSQKPHALHEYTTFLLFGFTWM